MKRLFLLLSLSLVLSLLGCSKESFKEQSGDKTIKVGFFPNISHPQALLGSGSDMFESEIDDEYSIEWKKFNAGPAELEALLTGEIDIGYIGPGPAVNGAYVSKGDIQIIAGASKGGAILVKRKGSKISGIRDLNDKKISIPQYGNTQDIVLRGMMKDHSLKDTVRGGKVEVVQAPNPDIKMLLEEKNIDAAFVPEPWGSRLENEIGAEVVLDFDQTWKDGDYPSAVIVARKDFVEENPEIVKQFLKAHIKATDYINKEPSKAKKIINNQIKELMREPLEEDVLDKSLKRLTVSYDPDKKSIEDIVNLSKEVGYLRGKPDLTDMFNMKLLNQVLEERGLKKIN